MVAHTGSSTGITIIRWPLWSDFVSEAHYFLKCAGIKKNREIPTTTSYLLQY